MITSIVTTSATLSNLNANNFVGIAKADAADEAVVTIQQHGSVDDAQSGWQHPMEKSSNKVTDSDPLKSQLEHFCRVVRGEEQPIVDGRDGTRSLAVVLAVLESIQHHVPVVLPAS